MIWEEMMDIIKYSEWPRAAGELLKETIKEVYESGQVVEIHETLWKQPNGDRYGHTVWGKRRYKKTSAKQI